MTRPTTTPERGAGTLGTAAGFLVFLLSMFTAVQVLFNLYATSMVTAAAHDAARDVAGHASSADRCVAAATAEARFHEQLGGYAERGELTLAWTCDDPNVVRLRVIATHPSLLPTRIIGLRSLSELDRTLEVRVEAER